MATYRPVDPAMPADRVSVRGIVTEDSVPAATDMVERNGGRVDAVRPKGPALIASMSYNHTTYRVRKLRPELTHLQAMGPRAHPPPRRGGRRSSRNRLSTWRGSARPTAGTGCRCCSSATTAPTCSTGR